MCNGSSVAISPVFARGFPPLTRSTFSPGAPRCLTHIACCRRRSARSLPSGLGGASEASGMTLSRGKVLLYRHRSYIHHTASPAALEGGGVG